MLHVNKCYVSGEHIQITVSEISINSDTTWRFILARKPYNCDAEHRYYDYNVIKLVKIAYKNKRDEL